MTTTGDALDLALAPGCSFTEEHWRPSQDYPEVTTHTLRQEGDELVVTTQPQYGPASVRRWRIVAVHRILARAVLAPLDPYEIERHLDLVTHRLVGAQEMVRVPLPISRDPHDPALLLGLLEVLAEVGPELYPSIAPRRFAVEELAAGGQRWAAPSGAAKLTSAPWIAELFGQKAPELPPGYGLSRDVGPGLDRAEVWIAEDAVSLLSVIVSGLDEPRAYVTASLPRHVTLEALARAVQRLAAVLAG